MVKTLMQNVAAISECGWVLLQGNSAGAVFYFHEPCFQIRQSCVIVERKVSMLKAMTLICFSDQI